MTTKYVIELTRPIGTNVYDTFVLLTTEDFMHYRNCRLLLIESLNKLGLCKTLTIRHHKTTYNDELIGFETLTITIK